MYMCKKDLALNNLQWLICHKTKPNKTKLIFLKIISIRWENLMPYNSKLFVLRIFFLNFNCFLSTIISFLKPYNYVQANDYNQMEIITLNHKITSIK